MGKPKRNVDGRRRNFGPDGDDLRCTLGCANRESRPTIEIIFGVTAEGSCHRMDDRHLRQDIGHGKCDARSQEVGNDDRRSSKPDGHAASKK